MEGSVVVGIVSTECMRSIIYNNRKGTVTDIHTKACV